MKILLISVEDKNTDEIIGKMQQLLTSRNHEVKVVAETEFKPTEEKNDCIFVAAPTPCTMLAESYVFMLLNSNKTDIKSYGADFYFCESELDICETKLDFRESELDFCESELDINAPNQPTADPAVIVETMEYIYNNFLQNDNYPKKTKQDKQCKQSNQNKQNKQNKQSNQNNQNKQNNQNNQNKQSKQNNQNKHSNQNNQSRAENDNFIDKLMGSLAEPGETVTLQKAKYLRFESTALIYLRYLTGKLSINLDTEELLEYVSNYHDIHPWDIFGIGAFTRDFMTLLYKQILNRLDLQNSADLQNSTDVDQAYYFRALYELGRDDELLSLEKTIIDSSGAWQYFAGKVYYQKAKRHPVSSNHLFELAAQHLLSFLKENALGKNDLGKNDLDKNDLNKNDSGKNDSDKNDLDKNDLRINNLYDNCELGGITSEIIINTPKTPKTTKTPLLTPRIKGRLTNHDVFHVPKRSKELAPTGNKTAEKSKKQKPEYDTLGLYEFFAEHSLLPGKTVVFAPYSKITDMIPMWFWNFLAEALEEQGFIVATICNFGEPPIEGTKPLVVPPKKLLPTLEGAGCFIGVRGKLYNMAESANCLKIAIYDDIAYHHPVAAPTESLQETLTMYGYNFSKFHEFEYTVRSEQTLCKTLTELVVEHIGGVQDMKQSGIFSKSKNVLSNLIRQKKRVGIMTWFFFHNYGAMLQAYATHYAIDAICPDTDTELINFIPEGRTKCSGVGTHILYENPPMEYAKARDMYLDDLNKRMELFESFKHEFMKLSETNYTDNKHLSAGCDYDVYLSGSDQIWNTSLVKSYDAVFPYMLGFTNNPNKISYGCGMAPRTQEPFELDFKYVQLLKPYKNFMMRENVAADTLKRYFDTPVDVILDPTLLLEAKEYQPLVRKPVYDIESSYIFSYILGRHNGNLDGELTEILTEFAKKHKKKIYLAYNGIPINNEFVTTLTSIGPCEWLWLIQNTDLVVTTSFHATAFSIIYNRPFICIFPDQRKTTLLDKVGFGDQTTLFEKVDNRGLKIDKFRKMLTLNVDYSLDYTIANKLLTEERDRCRALLKDAIDSCEC